MSFLLSLEQWKLLVPHTQEKKVRSTKKVKEAPKKEMHNNRCETNPPTGCPPQKSATGRNELVWSSKQGQLRSGEPKMLCSSNARQNLHFERSCGDWLVDDRRNGKEPREAWCDFILLSFLSSTGILAGIVGRLIRIRNFWVKKVWNR